MNTDQASARRARPPRRERTRSVAVAGLLIAGATVLGLASAGGTYALLSASAETPGVTITAGTLDLRVNNEAFAALGAWPVSPAAPAARAFTVSNVGDVPATLAAQITATTTQAITANTQVRITPVSHTAACTVGLQGTLADLNGYSAPTLDHLSPGQTKTFCLEVRLKPATPVEQSGQSVVFTVDITATQEAS